MAKEKFILVSLKEEESKHLAQVMSNDTARKILDYLADKEATESELSKKLGVPISTIHYNLQALLKGKLVEAEEFHYSEKGKEVLHYKLANKYIIIAPKSTYGIKEKLRSILPVGVLALVGTGILSFFDFSSTTQETSIQALRAVPESAADTAFASEAPKALAASTSAGMSVHPAVWFLIGCVFVLMLILIADYINFKRKNG